MAEWILGINFCPLTADLEKQGDYPEAINQDQIIGIDLGKITVENLIILITGLKQIRQFIIDW